MEHSGKAEASSTTSNGRLRATKATTMKLASTLSSILDRPVIDNTGLRGEFDYELEWAPVDDADSKGAAIFTALRQQLGLVLTSGKAPVDVLIIDRAEKPSEN